MPSWDEVTTYEQLEAMTPEQRSEHFRASIVLDPSTLPSDDHDRLAEMTARLNERTRAREAHLRGQAS